MGHYQVVRRAVAVAITVLGLAPAADAQTSAPSVAVGDFFKTLYGPAIRDVSANGGPTLVAGSWGGAVALNALLVAEITNLPTTTNAGGFTWTYDSTLGTWSRAVDSYGSQYVERSRTAGRHRLNFGIAYQRFTFDHLNDQPLSDATVDASGVLNSGLSKAQQINVQDHASLTRADVALATVYLNFGLTSTLDVGVFIPTATVTLEGSVRYTLQRTTPALNLTQTAAASAQSQISGPPVFRAKWNALRRESGGVSVAIDVRPHKDVALGAGGFKVQVIASRTSRAVNVQVNGGGSTFECDAEACRNVDAWFAAGGVDKAVTPKLTLSADLIASHIDVSLPGSQTLSATLPATARAGLDEALQTNRFTAAFTGKINLWGNLLLNLSALTSTNSHGLSDRFTPSIGLDYAW